MIPHAKVEHQLEDLLAVFALKWPELAIEFLHRRWQFQRSEKPANYRAIPYSLHSLREALARHASVLLVSTRKWFDEDRDNFQHYGGRLVAITFPAFSGELEALLLERVGTRDQDEIAFVISILRAYSGQTFLHGLCREIVSILPAGDQHLTEIEIILDSMGTTAGEFGRVTGFKRKRTEVEAWVQDPREQVRLFAERHLRSVDRQIASQQRHSEEELALRKLEYESPDDTKE